MRRLVAGLATVMALSTVSVSAQQFAGQWYCQTSYTELNRSGNRTSGHTREFAMALYPNGGFEAQGVMSGANGNHQFYASGAWQSEGDMMKVEGPEQQPSNPYYPPGMVFIQFGQMQGDGSLLFRYEMPDPSQSYLMNRSLLECRPQ